MTSELKGRSSDFKPSAFLRAPTCLPQQGDHLWGQPEALGCPHVPPHQRQHSQASGAGRGAPPLTNDREGACDLCRAEGVGDLTNVGAAVLSPQVTDGQPRDALGPAAVGWEGSAILEPADGRDGVTGGLEKEMATHSSVLAWEIIWTEKLGGLQCMGSQRAE